MMATETPTVPTWDPADYRTCPRIVLSDSDIDRAYQVAAARQANAIKTGAKDDLKAEYRDGVSLHGVGALAELAASHFLGLPWDGSYLCRAPDLPEGIEVRARRSHTYEPYLKRTDYPDRRYVFLTSTDYRAWRIRGWILGRNGMNESFWGTRPNCQPAFWIPWAALVNPSRIKR